MLDLQNNFPGKHDPWEGIIAATYFDIHSMYHTILYATPGKLLFGRDMMLNTPLISDWEAIRRRKKQLIYLKTKIKKLKTAKLKITRESTSVQ